MSDTRPDNSEPLEAILPKDCQEAAATHSKTSVHAKKRPHYTSLSQAENRPPEAVQTNLAIFARCQTCILDQSCILSKYCVIQVLQCVFFHLSHRPVLCQSCNWYPKAAKSGIQSSMVWDSAVSDLKGADQVVCSQSSAGGGRPEPRPHQMCAPRVRRLPANLLLQSLPGTPERPPRPNG